jgi:chromosome segregation ATPase
VSDHPRNRRIDRIREGSYLEGITELSLEELRGRRDECLAEREYLSLIRRMVQGRAEILQAEIEGREALDGRGPLVDRIARILAGDDDRPATSRGEAVRVSVPEEELMLARRRVERLVNDVDLSNPGALTPEALAEAVDSLATEEHDVSSARAEVLRVLDALQDELKRRYKEDPTLALR